MDLLDSRVEEIVHPAIAKLLSTKQAWLVERGDSLRAALAAASPLPVQRQAPAAAAASTSTQQPPQPPPASLPFPVSLAMLSALCLPPLSTVGRPWQLQPDQIAVARALPQAPGFRGLIEILLALPDGATKTLRSHLTQAAKRLSAAVACVGPASPAGPSGQQQRQQGGEPPAKRQRRLSRDARQREFRGPQDVFVRVAGEKEPVVLNVRCLLSPP